MKVKVIIWQVCLIGYVINMIFFKYIRLGSGLLNKKIINVSLVKKFDKDLKDMYNCKIRKIFCVLEKNKNNLFIVRL